MNHAITDIYTCPMHRDVKQNHPGKCPRCGMQLILESSIERNSYKPLIIIIALITLVTVFLSVKDVFLGNFHINQTMAYFMGGFFVVFAGFKLIDIKGFAEGYSTYDLLAQKIYVYGYVYPFFELTLGLLYSAGAISPAIAIFTFILMTFSGIGVAIKVAKHEKFQCACLGTFLKVPLTKVTLIEDFGMAVMALLMFVMR